MHFPTYGHYFLPDINHRLDQITELTLGHVSKFFLTYRSFYDFYSHITSSPLCAWYVAIWHIDRLLGNSTSGKLTFITILPSLRRFISLTHFLTIYLFCSKVG